MRHLRLVWKCYQLSWMQAMEYRVNFFLWTVINFFWTALDIVFFAVLVSNTKVIGNWTPGQVYIVLGLFRLFCSPLWDWMYQSFKNIPRIISEGRLDFYLAKPISNQFLISINHFYFNQSSSVVAGIILIFYGLNLLHLALTFSHFLAFLWLSFILILLMYGMYFSSVSLALYFDRFDNIQHLFPSLYDAAKYPREIYGLLLQRVFTFVVPIAIMLVIPAQVIWGQFDFRLIVWLHLITLAFFSLSVFLWNHGLLRYSSASS